MQKCEINSTDARSFQEIWKGLTKSQKHHLRVALISKFSVSSVAIYYWSIGKYSPSYQIDRGDLAETISEFMNIKTSFDTLFPNK